MNGYRAETPLRVSDELTLTLRIDYDAVGAFITLMDSKEWTSGIVKAFDEYDLDLVSKIIQIAAKRHHPDLTAKEIHDASPPFQAAYKSLEAAMFCFLYGHPQALENLDLSDPDDKATDADGEASGTTPLPNGRTRWRERGGYLLKLASGLNSGK